MKRDKRENKVPLMFRQHKGLGMGLEARSKVQEIRKRGEQQGRRKGGRGEGETGGG